MKDFKFILHISIAVQNYKLRRYYHERILKYRNCYFDVKIKIILYTQV